MDINTNLPPPSNVRDFMQSNNLFTRIVFLITAVIIFIVLLRVGTMIITYIYKPSDNPFLIKDMIDGRSRKTITQDPNKGSSVLIKRSKNKRFGLEFTWSMWLYITDFDRVQGCQLQHVFNKGNSPDTSANVDGIAFPNNAPGFYLGKVPDHNPQLRPGNCATDTVNNAIILMNTFSAEKNQAFNEVIVVPDLPTKKWLHFAIRAEGDNIDVYVNGLIVQRKKLMGVPKQNYDNVNVCNNGGFDGFLSGLRYYDHALGSMEISNIVYSGPSTKMESSIFDVFPPFFSLRWYLN